MINNTIYKSQYGIIVFFIPLVFKMAMLPALITEKAGNDAWITIFIMVALEFLQLIPIYLIANRGVLDDFKSHSNLLYRSVTIPYLAVFALKIMVFSSEISYYVTTFLFFNISGLAILIILFLVIVYVATRGGRAIGRLATISIWFLPALILLGATFGKTNLQFDYILPLFKNPVGLLSSVDTFSFWMFDFSPLLFIKVADKHKPRIWISAVCGIVAVTLSYLVFTANYGRAGILIDCAFARLASFNVISTDIGSIDWPGTMLWLLMGIITLSLKAYAAGEVIKDFSIKSTYSVVGFMVVTAVLTLLFANNSQQATKLATGVVRYVVIGIEIALPIIIALIYLLRKRKEKKPVEKEALENG